jgi:Family of unknown function (DUF5681)
MTEDRGTTGPGRFQKGQSGNPGGRPKLEGEIRDLAQRHGNAALKRLVQLMGAKNERVAVAAAHAILDRACGKPAQGIHLKGDGNLPALVKVEFVHPKEAE